VTVFYLSTTQAWIISSGYDKLLTPLGLWTSSVFFIFVDAWQVTAEDYFATKPEGWTPALCTSFLHAEYASHRNTFVTPQARLIDGVVRF
jgi:hypothetical protein